jgi:thioredoxin-related protein
MRSTTWLRNLAGMVVLVGIPALLAAGPQTSPPGLLKEIPPAVDTLEWLEYGEALRRAEREGKHVLVDFYTNWCGWCKKMDRDTYADSSVAAYLRQNFVLSKINAESPKRFKVAEGTMSGVEVAREFRVGSFPMTWFLKPDGSRLDKVAGYVPPDRFIHALRFVHERKYEKRAGN